MMRIKLFARLARINRKTNYAVGSHHVRVFKHRKKAIVYLDGTVIFNNTISRERFKDWWREFKEEWKNDLFTKMTKKGAHGRLINYMEDREQENPLMSKWDRQMKNL